MTRGNRTLVVAFTATSFLGAFLLFLVEPMAAKFLLPLLGGSPAVWNTAMVFFQATLLGGYTAAHLMLTRVPVRPQAFVQVALLALALLALPIALPGGWQAPTGGDPAAWTLLALAVMVGAPFFMLSTVGPTLQRWFSRTTHPRAGDPYFLYAAGNTGSLLALIAYPFVLEPAMPLSRQSHVWTWLYAAFVVACGACAALLLRHRATELAPTGTAPARGGASEGRSPPSAIGWRRSARWVLLAFIPSVLMLGVTRYLSSDIASVPLLWVVPLSLYLATFVVAFGRRPDRVVRFSSRAFRLLAVPLALSFLGIIPSLWIELPLQLAGFTTAALVTHGQLAVDRPGVTELTRFFLLLSLGGVLGGIFAALIAPLVFTSVVEYPIAIVMALAVLPVQPAHATARRGRFDGRAAILSVAAVAVAVAAVTVRSDGTQRSLTLAMIVAALGLAGAYVLARRPLGFAGAVAVVLVLAQLVPANPTLFAQRTFFGVHRVYRAPGGRHILLNGTTVHGMENQVNGRLDDVPISYYGRQGPLGDVFAALASGPPIRIAAIGAGAGSAAAYLRPGDQLTFFEIDDAVVRIASNPSLFSFVSDSKGSVRFVLGDGRIELGRSSGGFDLVIVDAFSGDAIPTHLLTDEAIRLYVQRIALHGLLAFNVSNRYFDLEPVLARVAAQEGLSGVVRSDTAPTAEELDAGELPSTWVVIARSPDTLGSLTRSSGWEPIGGGAGAPLWTDDYTDLLATLR
jgi:hypothetical protein